MGANTPLTRRRFSRLAPGGSAISAAALIALIRDNPSEEALLRQLLDRFQGRALTLHRSGREALRIAFADLAATSGRDEIAIPAYGCFSIPAAAVAANLKVRLVDVDGKGQIDRESLAAIPLDRVAGLVVGNLFGVPEPIEETTTVAHAMGARVVDDAAQTLGAVSNGCQVGARGDLGILSFGRGKPVSALGGGAIIWPSSPPEGIVGNSPAVPEPWVGLLRGLVYDVARLPTVLKALSAIPALGIGTTEYDPTFDRGSMPGSAIALADTLLRELEVLNRDRAKRAETIGARLQAETDFVPLLAAPNDTGIYPRLGVSAPSAAKRDAAIAALLSLGATGMYPTPLGEIGALRAHLVGERQMSGATDFCARLLTLPTHAGMNEQRTDEVIRTLRRQ
jgi:perosamine synthetase